MDINESFATWDGLVLDDGSVLLPLLSLNALYQLIPSRYGDFEAKYIERFDIAQGHREEIARLRIVQFERTVYFFSGEVAIAWVLNLDDLKIKKWQYADNIEISVADIVQKDNKAWVISNSFDKSIIEVDLKNISSRIIAWEGHPDIQEPTFIRADINQNSILLATRRPKNVFLCGIGIREKNFTYEKIELDMVNCLCTDNQYIWMFGVHNGRAVLQSYDISSYEIKREIKLDKTEIPDMSGQMKYWKMLRNADDIVLIPALAQEIVIIDIQSGKERIIPFPLEVETDELHENDAVSVGCNRVENQLYIFPFKYKEMLVFDLETYQIKGKKIIYDEEIYKKNYWREVIKNNLFFYENSEIKVTDFIAYAAASENEITTTSIGRRIYEGSRTHTNKTK